MFFCFWELLRLIKSASIANFVYSNKAIMKEDTESQDMGLDITRKAIEMLKTVYDPEIPVNVYDLGLIYKIDYDPADKTLHVDILEDVRQKLVSIEGPEAVDLRLVFEPTWTQDMMSEEAKLELGFL